MTWIQSLHESSSVLPCIAWQITTLIVAVKSAAVYAGPMQNASKMPSLSIAELLSIVTVTVLGDTRTLTKWSSPFLRRGEQG